MSLELWRDDFPQAVTFFRAGSKAYSGMRGARFSRPS